MLAKPSLPASAFIKPQDKTSTLYTNHYAYCFLIVLEIRLNIHYSRCLGFVLGSRQRNGLLVSLCFANYRIFFSRKRNKFVQAHISRFLFQIWELFITEQITITKTDIIQKYCIFLYIKLGWNILELLHSYWTSRTLLKDSA